MAEDKPWDSPVAGLRVALVHDWLTGMRGGEKCLEVLAEIFPDADLYTLLHLPGSVSTVIENRRVHTSFLQKLPAADRLFRWALPLFPRAIEAFDLSAYDLVVSSSHCVAKGAVPAQGALSICYCFTPMRYVWDRFDDYFGSKPQGLRQLISWQAGKLRRWDRDTAPRVGRWLAISTVVRQRILDFYGVDPERISIVFPPVDVRRFAGARALDPPGDFATGAYDLVVSALVPYKRVDLAIQAACRAGRTLVVVGQGPELGRLRALATNCPGTGRIHFAGAVSDCELPAWYVHCRCFVFPGLEDFGITPLEANAAGRPVVAYQAGGALDTITEGVNGIFFQEQTVAALADALADTRLDGDWNAADLQDHAARYDLPRYRREMTEVIETAWCRHRGIERPGGTTAQQAEDS